MRELDFDDGYETSAIPVNSGFPAEEIGGSFASPNSITAGGGITPSSTSSLEIQYVEGSGGAVDITANPQIGDGSVDGHRLTLIGTSDTNTLKLDNGDGLALNGSCTLGESGMIELIWDDGQSLWREVSRNDMA